MPGVAFSCSVIASSAAAIPTAIIAAAAANHPCLIVKSPKALLLRVAANQDVSSDH